MNPSPAPDQIRALVDAVATPSFGSIVDRAEAADRGRRPRLVLVVATAAILVVLLAAVIVALRPGNDDSRTVRVPAADGPAPLSDECLISATAQLGCPMSAADAAAHLGFAVRAPTVVPGGWKHVRAYLKVYRSGLSPQPVPPGPDVALYNQVWTEPGTDLDAVDTCPPYLQVRERLAFTGEEATSAGPPVDLGGSVPAFGYVSTASCGTSGPTMTVGLLSWVSDGILITVVSNGVDRADLASVVNSIGS
jgi:hypothetical protein